MSTHDEMLEPFRERTASLAGLLSAHEDIRLIYERMQRLQDRGITPEAASRELFLKLRTYVHRREEAQWLVREAMAEVTGNCIDLDNGGPCR